MNFIAGEAMTLAQNKTGSGGALPAELGYANNYTIHRDCLLVNPNITNV